MIDPPIISEGNGPDNKKEDDRGMGQKVNRAAKTRRSLPAMVRRVPVHHGHVRLGQVKQTILDSVLLLVPVHYNVYSR
jgi:hypothetical protein